MRARSSSSSKIAKLAFLASVASLAVATGVTDAGASNGAAPAPPVAPAPPKVRAPAVRPVSNAPSAAKPPAVHPAPISLHGDHALGTPVKSPAAAAKTAQPAKSESAHVPVFPAAKVAIGEASSLRGFIAGAAPAGGRPVALTPAAKEISEHLHLLMPGGTEKFERAFVTPTHVALVRKSGIIDVLTHEDAQAQIKTGQPIEPKRVEVGYGPKGFPVFAEEAPNGKIRLYRQLPKAAHGEISATDDFTSFALTEADAFHPWGEAGQTVTITIPRALLDRITTGELGGTGWVGKGGIAIDVVQEVQISTPILKSYLAGTWHG